MNSKNKLTDNLKRLRKDYSLTQDEVADIISKDRSSVAKYESGKALPPIDILKQLAKLYRQLIYKSADSEILIIQDIFLLIEYLADFQGNLCFFICTV